MNRENLLSLLLEKMFRFQSTVESRTVQRIQLFFGSKASAKIEIYLRRIYVEVRVC